MSITGSLSNALTGLTASSRAAELVSSNVANAMTDGYGRREIQLSARLAGGSGAGVQVDGVTRVVDQGVIRDRRLAEADLARSQTSLDFYKDLQSLIGVPEQPGSLGARVADLEAALIEAVSRPDLTARLEAVVRTAGDLTAGLNDATRGVQNLREDADAEIGVVVRQLNDDLARIAEVNALIMRNDGNGQDVSSLLDQRQQLVDRVASVVPIRVFNRDNSAIALYTATGGLLLDTNPAEFGFSPSPTITSDLSLAAGTLSGITINGREVETSGQYGPLAGGRLAELFQIRDDYAPAAQAQLDSIARDLIDRVASPAVDPTLAPGDAGFFTDGGLAFNPVDEQGLAGRIAVSDLVDPAAGGELWRLRDGLGAAVQGPAGNNTGLVGLRDALAAERVPASSSVTTVARSASGLMGDLASILGGRVRDSETALGYTTARFDSLRTIELASGVDTDQEMQKLLLIEQTYAANAQVIRTVDELIEILLGL